MKHGGQVRPLVVDSDASGRRPQALVAILDHEIFGSPTLTAADFLIV